MCQLLPHQDACSTLVFVILVFAMVVIVTDIVTDILPLVRYGHVQFASDSATLPFMGQ